MFRKVHPLLFESYMACIRNSLGTDIFRNYYALVDGEKKDIMEDGVVACALYLSAILKLFGLVERVHTTVRSTVIDLERSGWKKIDAPRPGSVIVWEGIYFEDDKKVHKHVGFYTGDERAISNSWTKRHPVEHHWTFGAEDGKPVRNVEAIYWHESLRPHA